MIKLQVKNRIGLATLKIKAERSYVSDRNENCKIKQGRTVIQFMINNMQLVLLLGINAYLFFL